MSIYVIRYKPLQTSCAKVLTKTLEYVHSNALQHTEQPNNSTCDITVQPTGATVNVLKIAAAATTTATVMLQQIKTNAGATACRLGEDVGTTTG